jgi:hypothetical protein
MDEGICEKRFVPKGILLLDRHSQNKPLSCFPVMKARLYRRSLLVVLLGIFCACVASAQTNPISLINITNVWRYEQRVNFDGINWTAQTYDDSLWSAGPALLYVEDNVAVAPRNTALTLGRMTYYFRTHFHFTNATSGASLIFSNRVDDGAVFYLNGVEVQRIRMPVSPNTILYGTGATGTPAGGDATAFDVFGVSGDALTNLVNGDNVLAVEVHQTSLDSSDIVFGTELTALIYTGPMAFVSHPTNTSIVDGRPAEFTALAVANPNPRYQWFKNGIPIVGATNRTYSIAAAFPSDAGTYFLQASNATETLASSNAVLTIIDDLSPPVALLAIGMKDRATIALSFNEAPALAAATNVAHYSVNPGAGTGVVQVLSAVVTSGTNVILMTTPRLDRANYTVHVEGVHDISSHSNSVSTNIPLHVIMDIVGIDANSIWRFNDTGNQPPSDWASLSFDESSWSNGLSLFYGGVSAQAMPEPVRATLALTNADGTNRVLTHYFRHRFEFPGNTNTSTMQLRHIVDDGAIFYLNGQEFYSIRMSATRPVYATNIASSTVGNAIYEPLVQSGISLPLTNLNAGENVLAVEVHQRVTGTSDAAFGANLEATIKDFSPVIRIFLPTAVGEADGVVTNRGALVLDAPVATNLTVQLLLEPSNPIFLPTEVILPIGATNVLFDIAITNDLALNGPRIVTVTAQAPGFLSSKAAIVVRDDEFTALHLTMPRAFREGDAPILGMVTVDRAPAFNAAITLNLSNAGLSVPTNVVIFAGTTAAVFMVSAVDDRVIEQTQLGTLTALFTNWTQATVPVSVFDNEGTNITLLLPASANEGEGIRINSGQVQLPGVASSNLVIALSSSEQTKLTVPTTVLILAGQSNIFFDVTIVDNALTDGTKIATVSAEGPGFKSAVGLISVADNDVHHFVFSDIGSPQFQETAFAVAIDAVDVNGLRLLSFSNQISLNAVSGGQAVANFGTNLIRFIGGRWTTNMTFAVSTPWTRLVAAYLGVSNESQPFDVDPPPVRVLSLSVNDVEYLASSGRLWATVGSGSPSYANSIVEIDPVAGAVISSFPIGPEPSRIVKTHDEEHFYVSYGPHPYVVSKGTYVKRFDVTNRQFSVTIGDGNNPVYDLSPVLGNPNLVVMGIRYGGGSAGDVRVYDNGIIRPNVLLIGGDPQLSHLERSETTNLIYGFVGGGFHRLEINGAGVTSLGFAGPIVNQAFTAAGALVYGGSGKIVDPQAGTLVGTYPDSGGYAIEVIAPLQRTYLMSSGENFPYSYSIRAYEQHSRVRAGTLILGGLGNLGFPNRLVHYGLKGLAFCNGSKLALVESDFLVPSNSFADLVIMQDITPDTNTAAGHFICTVTVSNRGPQVAFRPLITGSLPAGAILLSSNVSEGAVRIQSGVLEWRLSELPVSGTAVGAFLYAPTAEVILTNTLGVVSRNVDVVPGNSVSSLTYAASIPDADVRLVLSPSNVVVLAQQSFNLQWSISNAGPGTPIIIVSNRLQSFLNVLSSSASTGSLVVTNGSALWSVGTVASNASASAMLQLIFTNTSDVTVTNTVTALSTLVDPVASNNVAQIVLEALADNNGNGLGDTWELNNFGMLGVAPIGDADNDSVSNQQEFFDGTDPNDSSNVLRIVVFALGSNSTSLTFFASRGHDYAVERDTSLGSSWKEVLSVTGESKRVTWSEPLSGNTVFYRVRRK